jgi:hypothetical protein
MRSIALFLTLVATSEIVAQSTLLTSEKVTGTPAEAMMTGMTQMMTGMEKAMGQMTEKMESGQVGPGLTTFDFITQPQHRFAVQAMFGIPNGIRGQIALKQSGSNTYLFEAYTGGRDKFWGDEWVLGLGGRIQTTISQGKRGSWLLAPGIGVSYWRGEKQPPPVQYYWYDPAATYSYQPKVRGNQWYLNLDANLSYLLPINEGLAWEFGMYFGARIGISGEEAGGETVSGKIKGLIGGFTGFRF